MFQKNKAFWLILGFLLFLIGFLSIFLSMIGVQFVFLKWLDDISTLFGFVMKLVMIISGIAIVSIATSSWDGEEA